MEKHRKLFICLSIAFPVLIICGYIFRQQLMDLGKLLPPCPFYLFSGYHCPGCGNTRSITHLLSGELLLSLRCNITPLFLFLIIVMLYIEMLFYIFGKRVKLLPRSMPLWISVILLFMVYFAARNFIGILAPV